MALLVTVEDVEDVLGYEVEESAITKAQFQIGSYLGLGLADDEVTDELVASDLANLKNAIIWQVDFNKNSPDASTRDPAVQSASTNGVSVSYRAGDTDQILMLGSMAMRCINLLSWNRAGVRIRRAKMRRVDDCERPDPWVTLSRGGSL